MAAKQFITHEQLKKLLHYDPETGIFTWLVNRSIVRIGDIAGCIKNNSGYRKIIINKRCYSAHRLAWLYVTGDWPPREIDHINRDGIDNRWANLRLATRSENMQNAKNARRNSKSGILGVFKDKDSRFWHAQIAINGKQRYIGSYATPELAQAAYLEEKKKLHPFAPKDTHVEEIP